MRSHLSSIIFTNLNFCKHRSIQRKGAKLLFRRSGAFRAPLTFLTTAHKAVFIFRGFRASVARRSAIFNRKALKERAQSAESNKYLSMLCVKTQYA